MTADHGPKAHLNAALEREALLRILDDASYPSPENPEREVAWASSLIQAGIFGASSRTAYSAFLESSADEDLP